VKSTHFLYRFFPFIFIYIASVGVIIPKGSIATQLIGTLILLTTIYYFIRHYISTNLFNILLAFLLYISFLSIFSSKFLYSLSNIASAAIWMLVLPISFFLINNISRFKKLLNSIALIGVLYIINIIISTVFGITGKSYSREIFQVGNLFTEGLNSMAYILVATPLIIHFRPKNKRVIFILAIIIFVLVFVQLKRISILAILTGLMIQIIYSKNRISIAFGLIASVIIMLVAFPLYENILSVQYKVRERRLTTVNIEEEGRYQETFHAFNETIFSNDLKLFLFGKEVFNSPGNYANGRFGPRMIHNDYNMILHGSGVIGLLLFICWPIPLYVFYRKMKILANHSFEDKRLFDIMTVLFLNLLIMGYLISLSGGINAILFNSIRVALMGSILRILYEYACKTTLNHKQT